VHNRYRQKVDVEVMRDAMVEEQSFQKNKVGSKKSGKLLSQNMDKDRKQTVAVKKTMATFCQLLAS